MDVLDLAVAAVALAVAVALQPWRAVGAEGPPWPWLAWCALLPLFWGADRVLSMPLAQPLSGACLLLLMTGWPLAILGMAAAAVLTALLADLSPAEALQRYVWLGIVPATVAMAIGAAMRRWLPHHLMVYILGRGFFASAIAGFAAGWAAAMLHGVPYGLAMGDLLIGRFLAAWGDAFIVGMFAAIFVAFRPQWLATYTDRLYLPR